MEVKKEETRKDLRKKRMMIFANGFILDLFFFSKYLQIGNETNQEKSIEKNITILLIQRPDRPRCLWSYFLRFG